MSYFFIMKCCLFAIKFKYLLCIPTIIFRIENIVVVDLVLLTEVVLQR